MDVHASPAALPEWHTVLNAVQVRVRRPDGGQALERYLPGLRTALPNQNGETMAQAIPGTRAQRLQEVLTTRPWDEDDLHHQRVQKLMAEATLGDGVLVVDDPGVPKPGQGSVGVARQDAGTLGQVGHGPVAVPCGDPEPQATWPVAMRLYLPAAWAEDLERRQPARMPAAVTFHTKPELALARLEPARAWGVPSRGGVADAADGAKPNCLAGLEGRQERDVGGVRRDVQVSMGRAARHPVRRAEAWRRTVPRGQWRTMRWRQGTKGWRRKPCGAVRCWRVTADGQRYVGWLVGERATRGQPEARQDHWRHLAATATREAWAGDAHRR
jgi:SRSO17 transposase